MGATNVEKGDIYKLKGSSILPYDIHVVLIQNLIVYFFLSSGDRRIGNYKATVHNFNELFSLNRQMPARSDIIRIPTDKFDWFNMRIIK